MNEIGLYGVVTKDDHAPNRPFLRVVEAESPEQAALLVDDHIGSTTRVVRVTQDTVGGANGSGSLPDLSILRPVVVTTETKIERTVTFL